MNALRVGAWWALLLVLAACRTPVSPTSVLSPDDPRPAAWMRALEDTAKQRQSLRAEARFSLDAPDLRFRRPERLVVARPAKLRVEVQGLFGQVAAVLATDGQRYQWFEASKRKIEEGVVDEALLWRLARIDLTPTQAVSLLLGAPVPLPGFSRTAAEWTGEGTMVVRFSGPRGGSQRFVFDAAGRPTEVSAQAPDGARIWEARFAGYEQVDGVAFAHEVSLEFPRVNAHASVRFRRVELNPALSAGTFVLQLGDRSS